MSEFEAGVLLIDKPAGPTSFNIVRHVRRILGIKKVGHAGALDPFASGLLVVCAGRPATKLVSSIMEGEKEYEATLVLGVETGTQDPEGDIIARRPVGRLSGEEIEKCLCEFRGEQEQVPPAYSALKHKGKPLYYYARKGIEIRKEARKIRISSVERLDGDGEVTGDEASLALRIVCGKGVYIRTLAADIGRRLGCGAYLGRLRRTRSGCFSVENALRGELLQHENARRRVTERVLSVNEICNLLH